jgi:hypothetical protein
MTDGVRPGDESPAVAYCIFHQAAAEAGREEYARTLRELHELLREQGTAAVAEHPRALRDAVLREVQVLLGSLAPFLETPMRGDAFAVRGILEESLGKFAARFAGGLPASLQYSLEGRVHIPTAKRAAERKLLQQGREYLAGLGFETSKAEPPLHESMFVVSGGAGLDLLEHLVRDRIGIYGPTHGRHLSQFHRSSYAAYNLIHRQGPFPEFAAMPGWSEAALFFAKPRMLYGEFREQLASVAAGLGVEIGPAHLSIWQRKLGLGPGVEFALRIVTRDSAAIGAAVQWLTSAGPSVPMKQALLTDGRLVLKEVLFPS